MKRIALTLTILAALFAVTLPAANAALSKIHYRHCVLDRSVASIHYRTVNGVEQDRTRIVRHMTCGATKLVTHEPGQWGPVAVPGSVHTG